MRIVGENIKATNKQGLRDLDEKKNLLKSLSKMLQLKKFPHRIEIYDNSHLNGTDSVGAMVVYENNSFVKSLYKKFNIISLQERVNDDYFMLKQVIERRFNLSQTWKRDLPNLILLTVAKDS